MTPDEYDRLRRRLRDVDEALKAQVSETEEFSGTPMERWRAHEAIHANLLGRIENLEKTWAANGAIKIAKRLQGLEDNAHCPDNSDLRVSIGKDHNYTGPCPECGAQWEPIGDVVGVNRLKRQHQPNCAFVAARKET